VTSPVALCFLWGEILPNFDLQNMISTYTKGFSMKRKAQIRQIWGKKKIQIARFLI
jgi:hypothetical protein